MKLFISVIGVLTATFLSSCHSRSDEAATVANESASSNLQTKSNIPSPSLLNSIPHLQEKAGQRQPTSENDFWSVYKMGDVYFGRSRAEPEVRFATRDVSLSDANAVLRGHSAVIWRSGRGQSIATEESTVTELDGANFKNFKVSGGRTKVIAPIN